MKRKTSHKKESPQKIPEELATWRLSEKMNYLRSITRLVVWIKWGGCGMWIE
jgi:hypothetical protein